MTTIEKFTEVLKTEAEVADAILGTLYDQQQAIIHFRDGTMMAAVERQRQLIEPMESLERERQNLCAAFDSTMRSGAAERFSLSTLARKLPESDAAKLLGAGKLLKGKVEKIMKVNNQNKMLLDNSLRFVRHSLRIMTDNYAKKLIDTKM